MSISKNNTLNLLLLIIVSALASFIYFSDDPEKESKLAILTDVDINSIQTILITHKKNPITKIEKTKNHWSISKPIKIDANDFRIKTLLKLLNAPVHNQYSINEIDIKSIGLDRAKTTIAFNSHIISFGVINPATNLRYVKLNDTVYTLEDVYFPLLNSHFTSLVSLNLLPTNSKVTKLILINQTISKTDNQLWQSNIDISSDDIVKTIDYWQTTQAFGIHQYLERAALGEIFVYTETQQQAIRFQITDTEPWLIIARPELNLEYHLEIESYDQLITPQ